MSAAADLFAPADVDELAGAAGLDRELRAGLELLERGPPLWPIGAAAWTAAAASVSGFALRWDARASAAGWSRVALYGLHQRAPWARLSAMGAAWLLARSGDRAIAIEAEAIVSTTWSGGRLRIYRSAPDPDAVVAWALFAHPEAPRRAG